MFFKINDVVLDDAFLNSGILENEARTYIPIDYHQTFDLTEFVCNSQGQTCNTLSRRLAESLIRVAATRIFSDPSQSIIELPVNSVDAYRRMLRSNDGGSEGRSVQSARGPEASRQKESGSIGKFGLGFFSFLYWLYEYPNAKVTIKSQTPGHNSWTLVIGNRDNRLYGYFQYSLRDDFLEQNFAIGHGLEVLLHQDYNVPRILPPTELMNKSNANNYMDYAIHCNDIGMFDRARKFLKISQSKYQAKTIDAITYHYFDLALHIMKLYRYEIEELIYAAIAAHTPEFMAKLLKISRLDKIEDNVYELVKDGRCLEYLLKNQFVTTRPFLLDRAISTEDYVIIEIINRYSSPDRQLTKDIFDAIIYPDLYRINEIAAEASRLLLVNTTNNLMRKGANSFYQILEPFFAAGISTLANFTLENGDDEYKFCIGVMSMKYPQVLFPHPDSPYFRLGRAIFDSDVVVDMSSDEFDAFVEESDKLAEILAEFDDIDIITRLKIEPYKIQESLGFYIGKHASLNLVDQLHSLKNMDNFLGAVLAGAASHGGKSLDIIDYILMQKTTGKFTVTTQALFAGVIGSCWSRDFEVTRMFQSYFEDIRVLEDKRFVFINGEFDRHPNPQIVERLVLQGVIDIKNTLRIFRHEYEVLAHLDRLGMTDLSNFSIYFERNYHNPYIKHFVVKYPEVRTIFHKRLAEMFYTFDVTTLEYLFNYSIASPFDFNRYKDLLQANSVNMRRFQLAIMHGLDLNFADKMYMDFRRQLDRLRYVSDVEIYLWIEPIPYSYNLKFGQILMTINNNLFGCRDVATGVPLSVLYNQMLVPSSSTKTIAASAISRSFRFTTWLSQDYGTSGGLIITVGDVVVVNVGKSETTYLLRLPIDVPLPVSRDDILFNEQTIPVMYRGFLQMVNKCITWNYNLEDYFSCLRDYIAYSSSSSLANIVQQVEKETISRQDVIFLPDGDLIPLLRKQYSAIFAHYSTISLVESKTKLDRLFGASLGKNIYQGQRVIPVEGLATITDGGIPGFIFYPEDMDERRLVDSYTKVLLQSFVASDMDSDYEAINFIMTNILNTSRDFVKIMTDIKPLLNSLYHVVETRFLNFNGESFFNGSTIHRTIGTRSHTPESISKSVVISTILIIYENIFPYCDHTEFVNIASEYTTQQISFFSNFKINVNVGDRAKVIIEFIFENYPYEFFPNYTNDLHHSSIVASKLSKDTRDKIVQGQFEAIQANLDQNGYLRFHVMMDDLLVLPHRLYSSFLREHRSVAFDAIVQASRNAVEASCLITVLYRAKSNFYLSQINFVAAESRKRFSTSYFLDLLRYRKLAIPESRGVFEREYLEPLTDITKIFARTTATDELGEIPFLGLLVDKVFTARQLVTYVFDKGITSFEETKNNVGNYPPNENLQIIEIAVNEGTSKDFVPSVLTELVQNSLDAIRSSGVDDDDHSVISLNTYVNGLSVSDSIGIDPDNLIFLLVPFLSSKSAKDMMTTGEMGTGFFNVYRQPWVQEVIIYSGEIAIIGTPVVVNRRVVDIEYKICQAIRVPGTTIWIKFYQLPREENLSLMLETSIFVRNNLGHIPAIVKFNGEAISIAKELIYRNVDLSVYIAKDKNIRSLVLTNGIPLAPLGNYLAGIFGQIENSDILNNLIIDFNKSAYIPSQSRNRLRISDDTKFNFRLGLINGLNALILANQVSAESYLPNFYSKATLDQFVGYAGNPRVYLTGSQDPYGIYATAPVDSEKQTMVGYINLGIARMKNQPTSRPKWRQLIGTVDPKTPTSRLIVNWFASKGLYLERKIEVVKVATSSVGTTSGSSEEGDKVLVSYKAKKLLSYLNYFVRIYFWTGKMLNFTKGVEFKTIPLVEFGQTEQALAVYRKEQDDIVVNLIPIETIGRYNREFEILMHKMKSEDRTEANRYLMTSSLGKWIGNKTPASILIHEMQHVLYQNDHQSDSHGIREIVYNGKKMTLTFDEACVFVYSEVCAAGFWDKMAANFDNL